MNKVSCILSLLHESPAGSATRLFRDRPVLQWTLERLGRAGRLDSMAVLCWDDQLEAASPIAAGCGANVAAKGERTALVELDSITTAQRWADGWRGGLLSTCHFDLGFHAGWHQELLTRMSGDAVVLVDPSSALVDPALIDGLIAHAAANESCEICFAPAPPGLGAVIVQSALLARLAAGNTHPGRLMHYHPDHLSRELLAADSCLSIPTAVARNAQRFTLDSDRQVRRLSAATETLNGQLMTSSAEDLVRRAHAHDRSDSLPREVVLELNTARSTRPIYWPGSTLAISRPDLSLAQARRLFGEMSILDDTLLTLAGVGDPLLHPDLFAIIEAAKQESPAVSIHLETDLYDVSPEIISRLAASPVDVISIHLPAASGPTYLRVMGCDGYASVVENVRRLVTERAGRRSGVPIIVPTFTKCRENAGEMEAWYDQWLRAVGSAVIRGPSDCAGQIPDVAVADMAPGRRTPCGRLASRVTILSDGRVVSCEEDVAGQQVMGRLGAASLRDIWQRRFEAFRGDHRQERWSEHPLCARCREWHRP